MYQLLINELEETVLEFFNDPRALLEYSTNMNNIYIISVITILKKSIVLIAFNMIADGDGIIYLWKKMKNFTCSYNNIIIFFILKNVGLNLKTISS